MESQLIAHVNSDYATVEELEAVPCPAPTATWKPIPHKVVRDCLINRLHDHGMYVQREQWALSDPTKHQSKFADEQCYTGRGARMFGLINVRNGWGTDDWSAAVAVRSSLDKSLKLGIAAGLNVFICDNISLCGEQVVYRMHTPGLDLEAETDRAIGVISSHMGIFSEWFDKLKAYPMPNDEFDGIVADALYRDLLPRSTGRQLLRLWRDQDPADAGNPGLAERIRTGVYREPTAYTAHNLMTDLVGHRLNFTSGNNDASNWHRQLNRVFEQRLLSPLELN